MMIFSVGYSSIFLFQIHRFSQLGSYETIPWFALLELVDHTQKPIHQDYRCKAEQIYQTNHREWLERQGMPLQHWIDEYLPDLVGSVTWVSPLEHLVRSPPSSSVRVFAPGKDRTHVPDEKYQMYRNTSHGQIPFLEGKNHDFFVCFWLWIVKIRWMP